MEDFTDMSVSQILVDAENAAEDMDPEEAAEFYEELAMEFESRADEIRGEIAAAASEAVDESKGGVENVEPEGES